MPRLGIGTATLGYLFEAVDDESAHSVLAGAIEAGLTLIDTAPAYGVGLAETRIGKTLSAAGTRESVTLVTKVGRVLTAADAPAYPGGPMLRLEPDWTADGIRRCLEDSLQRLETDWIDIVYLHDAEGFEDEVARTAYPALIGLQEEGVVRAIGFGMNYSAPLTAYVERFQPDVVQIANELTLLDHTANQGLLQACQRHGVSVVAAGVFSTGLLAHPAPGARYRYHPAPESLLARARHAERICIDHGVALSTAAMQLPLLHASVASVVIGCRSAQEVADNAAMFARVVPHQCWQELAAEGFVPAGLLDDTQ